MEDTLELVPLDQGTTTDGDVIDVIAIDPAEKQKAIDVVRTSAIAPLSTIEKGIAALREQHGATDYDITTAKGLALAKARRHAIRQVRYQVPHIVKAQNDELKKLGKEIAAEGDRIIAALSAMESPHHELIQAEEARLEEERQKEAARVEAHQANLTKLRGQVVRAQGKTSAEIRAGIESLRFYAIDAEAWQEFAEEAERAKEEAIKGLTELADATERQEAEAAEAERIRLENEARAHALQEINRITSIVSGAFGKASADIKAIAAELADQQGAAADVSPDLFIARQNAITQLEQMAAMAQQMEALKAAQAPAVAQREAEVQQQASEHGQASSDMAKPVQPPSTPVSAIPAQPAPEVAAAAPIAAGGSEKAITASADANAVFATGEWASRMGFGLTSSFIESLGFSKVIVPKKVGAYFLESDFDPICEALKAHITKMQAQHRVTALAA